MISWYDVYYSDTNTLEKINPSSELKFKLKKNIRIETNNYHDALRYNASALADYEGGTLDVLLSGGIDSEVVVRINHELGIKQNVYVFKFENNLNIRDVNSAKQICKNLNIPLKVIDFNIKKFFEKEAEHYYKKTFCSRVEGLPRLKWHEYFDNTLIFGDGEPYLKRKLLSDYDRKSSWEYVFLEYEFQHYLYTSNLGKNIICPWYHFTPEIHANFLKLSTVEELIQDKRLGKQSTMTSKSEISQFVFPLINSKIKLVGYEGKIGLPGNMPDFMQNFKDTIMTDVVDTEIHLSLDSFKKELIWK